MTETSNNLNLLSRQQTVKQCISKDEDGIITLEFLDLRIKSDETTTADPSLPLDNIRIELENVKIEECGQSERHRNLTATFDILEDLLERTLQHVDCSILEMKSSDGLLRALERFGRIWSDGDWWTEKPPFSKFERLDLIRDRLVTALERQAEIQGLRLEYEESRADLRLAIKNFKIVLEVLDVNDSTLRKLKGQFEEVTSRYAVSRLRFQEKMSTVFTERMQILRECLDLLAEDGKFWIENRKRMCEILEEIGRGLEEDNL